MAKKFQLEALSEVLATRLVEVCVGKAYESY